MESERPLNTTVEEGPVCDVIWVEVAGIDVTRSSLALTTQLHVVSVLQGVWVANLEEALWSETMEDYLVVSAV